MQSPSKPAPAELKKVVFQVSGPPPRHTAQSANQILTGRNGQYFIGKKKNSRAQHIQNSWILLMKSAKAEIGLAEPLPGPLAILTIWRFAHPQNARKFERSRDIFTGRRPDEDNLKKLFHDCLGKAGIIKDDGQFSFTVFAKVYSPRPGIVFFIKQIRPVFDAKSFLSITADMAQIVKQYGSADNS